MIAWKRIAAAAFAVAVAVSLSAGGSPQEWPKRPYDAPRHGSATVTEKPEKDGMRVRVPLDPSLHLKNVGGANGAGLCVFTSISHTAHWQGIEGLKDFRDWMRSHQGGGWPEKVDQKIEQKLGKNHGISYIHVYSKEAFPLLEKAIRSGRMPCITYGYGERYGVAIDHMVNLVFLDGDWACVLDNNFPDSWEWMPREEFEERFEWTTQGKQQGWAIIFIDNPQPPLPIR